MKRLALLILTACLVGGVAMAQTERRGDKMPDPKVRAERMTERMAKEYSLNDAQKKQLLEANLAMVDKMKDSKMMHKPVMRRGKGKRDACTCKNAEQCPKKADKEKAEKKGDKRDDKRVEEMKAARMDYDAQLQKIMTKEQYASYTKNVENRQAKAWSGRREVRKN